MRQRSVSSIGVVLLGLVPAVIGGLVFAIAFVVICILAFTELATMMKTDAVFLRFLGYVVIVLAGSLAYFGNDNDGLPVLVAAAVIMPSVFAICSSGMSPVDRWPQMLIASFYVATPAFAAVSIRQFDGQSAGWLGDLSGTFLPDGSDTGRGLGWFLLALFVTWVSDTGAYMVGKTVGRRKLSPRVSPNKTVEGAVGGVVCSAVIALLCSWLFELGIRPWLAVLLGVVLGAAGTLGDLAESMIKRQHRVKDSGTLIPGHGGVLDRIDALLFVLVTVWMLIPVLSWLPV